MNRTEDTFLGFEFEYGLSKNSSVSKITNRRELQRTNAEAGTNGRAVGLRNDVLWATTTRGDLDHVVEAVAVEMRANRERTWVRVERAVALHRRMVAIVRINLHRHSISSSG